MSKAPITEAVLEIRVISDSEQNIDLLAESFKLEDYPIKESQVQIELKGEVSTEGKEPQSLSESARNIIGWQFRHKTNKQTLRVSTTSFGFSRLAPYENWDSFSGEARELWCRFSSIVKPSKITRLALRYINKIDIPGDRLELTDYFKTYPQISDEASGDLTGYFMRLISQQRDLEAKCVIHMGSLPSPNSETHSTLLDIDLFRTLEADLDEDLIWEILTKFRDRKNELFVACLTEKTLEMFK